MQVERWGNSLASTLRKPMPAGWRFDRDEANMR